MAQLRITLMAALGTWLGAVTAPAVSLAQADDTSGALLGGAALGEGSPAPALHIQKWLAGSEVSALAPGRVYVVEFFASWCPASRKAVPVLTRAQERHAGKITVIAVAGADGQEETSATVERFVLGQGAGIGYAVAFDDRRKTARAWMDAAEQTLIPTVFIVDRSGAIAWIGNPIWPPGEFDDALEQVVAGTFGPTQREATRQRWLDHRERVGALESTVQQADMEGRPDQALLALESLLELNTSGAGAYALRKFNILLHAGKDPSPAYQYGRSALEGPLNDDAHALNELAWTILDEDGLAKRDIELAHRAAARAVELTGGREPAILDTLARAWRERGDLDKAVEFQTRAVEAAAGPEERDQYAQVLDEYRALAARKKDR